MVAVTNGNLESVSSVLVLDASKLTITIAENLLPIPEPETLGFGQIHTDHMLTVSFNPTTGWSAPEIKPYTPVTLDPMSSCLQYATNIFEGMKAYIGPNGEARLFRPDQNVARLAKSAERVVLPSFDQEELLKLIQKLVALEKRWIPVKEGYSLYIRPTMIGTSPGLNLVPSNNALLYVVLSPAGPFFRSGLRPLALLGVKDNVRAWPGGTGAYKLSLNYSPAFLPQRLATKKGYDQILWLLGDVVTEAGAMNFFVILKRDDDDGIDVVTPALDGTILPGITRSSCLTLCKAHGESAIFEGLPKMHVVEKRITMNDLKAWNEGGKLLESFAVGTAVIVAPVGKIGHDSGDLILPTFEAGLGPVGSALWRRLLDIQEGKSEWENWSVVCK
ncbi:aminotransferase [Mucidula mucida]|nr:aminotransferase [Mucidula mucida]